MNLLNREAERLVTFIEHSRCRNLVYDIAKRSVEQGQVGLHAIVRFRFGLRGFPHLFRTLPEASSC